ncbi:MAG: hypothetical protein ACTSUO_00800 [Candidatus Thorarchaeota archaeon]
MKLKVICQNCGKTTIVDTKKPTPWRCLKTSDIELMDDLREEWEVNDEEIKLEWEFWLCGDCYNKLMYPEDLLEYDYYY